MLAGGTSNSASAGGMLPSEEGLQQHSASRLPAVRQRDPVVFSSMEVEDVDDWLDSFDGVCRHNNWDVTTKLNNIVFHPLDVAKMWFVNLETDFQELEMFSSRFYDFFGRLTLRSAEAQQKMTFWVQRPDETYTTYVEDVFALCRHVNSQMPEPQKCCLII